MKEENTITAYKAFDMNMKCRGFQYEVGKEYELDGEIECCSRGFTLASTRWMFYFTAVWKSRFSLLLNYQEK